MHSRGGHGRLHAKQGELQTHRHRQLARRALQLRLFHRKRQPRLATLNPAEERARAERIVEVGRVHERAVVGLAALQLCYSVGISAPRLRKRAVAGAVLKARGIEAVVERRDAASGAAIFGPRAVFYALCEVGEDAEPT